MTVLAGKAEGCLVLSREAPASWNLGWLLMENSGFYFTVPFWSLGSQKLSVVLNYSEAHISSVSKKSTPMARNATNCLSLFVLDLEWWQGAGLPLCLLEKIPVGLWVSMSCLEEIGAGWSMGWCQGRRPIAQVLVLLQICPVAFREPGNGVSHTLVYLLIRVGWEDGVGLVKKECQEQPGASSFGPGIFQYSRMLSC